MVEWRCAFDIIGHRKHIQPAPLQDNDLTCNLLPSVFYHRIIIHTDPVSSPHAVCLYSACVRANVSWGHQSRRRHVVFRETFGATVDDWESGDLRFSFAVTLSRHRKPSLEVAPTAFATFESLLTYSFPSVSAFHCLVCPTSLSVDCIHNGTCQTATLNVDLWPLPQNLTYIVSRHPHWLAVYGVYPVQMSGSSSSHDQEDLWIFAWIQL